jgi:hypothetical protein
MLASFFRHHLPAREAMALQLFVLSICLGGCADMSDSLTAAFVNPAKYDLYSCKQLETERKRLLMRSAELHGLIAKADTGFAGPLVSELAYRNDYIATRGQARLADEVWHRNKCKDSQPVPTTPSMPSRPPTNSDEAPPPESPGAEIN